MAEINNPGGEGGFRGDLNQANGAIPIIFSKKLALAFGIKGMGVTDNLTNENYAGEISQMGDRVRIVIPEVPDDNAIAFTDGDVAGTNNAQVCPTFQTVAPEALDLIINKKATFGLAIDDVQKAQTQFKSWLEGQASTYGEKLRSLKNRQIAKYIFNYPTQEPTNPGYTYTQSKHRIAGEYGTIADPFSANMTGTPTGTNGVKYDVNSQNIFTLLLKVKENLIMSGAIGADGVYSFKPMEEETRDERAVIVVTPAMHSLILSSYRVGGRSADMADVVVKDGAVSRVAGLDVVIDKTLVELAEEEGHPTVMPFLAGTKNAVTRASQISKVESVRDIYCFRDLIKGLELYGYKMVHPECIVRGALPAVELNEALPVVNVTPNP